MKPLLMFILFFAMTMTARSQCTKPQSYFEAPLNAGMKIPEFHIEDPKGNLICPHRLQGTPLLIVFWQDSSSIPFLNSLSRMGISPAKLKIITIEVQGSKSKNKPALSPQWIQLKDDGYVAKGWQKLHLPFSVLVDSNSFIQLINPTLEQLSGSIEILTQSKKSK